MNTLQQNKTMPQDGYVRLPAVLAFLSISKTTFYAGIRAGVFPSPFKYFASVAKRMYAKRPSDLEILKTYLAFGE